jgi:hypothetical protein
VSLLSKARPEIRKRSYAWQLFCNWEVEASCLYVCMFVCLFVCLLLCTTIKSDLLLNINIRSISGTPCYRYNNCKPTSIIFCGRISRRITFSNNASTAGKNVCSNDGHNKLSVKNEMKVLCSLKILRNIALIWFGIEYSVFRNIGLCQCREFRNEIQVFL